jgi:hypothetical protein
LPSRLEQGIGDGGFARRGDECGDERRERHGGKRSE